jgi:hypothetical protein
LELIVHFNLVLLKVLHEQVVSNVSVSPVLLLFRQELVHLNCYLLLFIDDNGVLALQLVQLSQVFFQISEQLLLLVLVLFGLSV